MAVDFVAFSGRSNVGRHMTVNEDYILFNDTAFGDDILFTSVADGSGSKDSLFNPAAVAVHQSEKMLSRLYKKNTDLFRKHIRLFLEESFYSANDTLIGFKLGNESDRYGFATTMTSALIERRGVMTFAHAGNSRIYLIRDQTPFQITKDHTEGQKLVDEEKITEEAYYRSMERLSLYSGIGVTANPVIQTGKIKLQQNDVIILTTDGVHYAMRPESFFPILMETQTMDEAAEKIISDSLSFNNYFDNLSVNVIWYLGNNN